MTTLFHIKGPNEQFGTHENCPRVQSRFNLMQGYIKGKENRKKKNTYKPQFYPYKPQFYHIKVGFELGGGLYFITCLHDVLFSIPK